MISRTPNPFRPGGWMHQAWQEGYDADIYAENPYKEDTALTEQWNAGYAARKADELFMVDL